MSVMLVPFNQAMRLGQGYNTYLQQICIDRAVTFGPEAIQTGPSQPGDVATVPPNANVTIRQEVLPGEKPQIVTYRTAFADKLSDVVENLNISAAAGIRTGTLSANGSASYVNENKFKESNINFVVNVKVTNDKMQLDQELLTFNEIAWVKGNQSSFTEHYGDGFVSGFISGGELNAIVNIKVTDKSDIMAVKASLQVSMKMVNAEGKGEYENSEASKSAETNITINWSGGGQIKEPQEQWNIGSLLKAAAAFPNKVAECPQRTWAIITKYKHLRDYVEKMPKATFIEYELAASYTAVLLDNFIEYKLMMKNVGAIMDTMAEYQQSPVKNSYAVDVESLVKARWDIQREMAKIVVRVNDISVTPTKALDLAKDTVPDGTVIITDSHLYSARLPVKGTKLVAATATPLPQPTPRPKLDPSSIAVTYRSKNPAPPGDHFRQEYKFNVPRTDPPQFATGITYLDEAKDKRLRLQASVNSITTEKYEFSLVSWDDTVKFVAGGTWFEVSPTDPDFQTGIVMTHIPLPGYYPGDNKLVSIVYFPRVFKDSNVEVLVWLNHLDADTNAAGFLNIDTAIQNPSSLGFWLSHGALGAKNYVNTLGYSWIAYPKNKKGVESGSVARQPLPPGADGKNKVQGEVRFTKQFRGLPQVWLAWSGMDIKNTTTDDANAVRFWCNVVGDSISATGFKYEMVCHGIGGNPPTMTTGSLYWIAVELD